MTVPAKKPEIYLASLTFSGGDQVEFAPSETVILVGPNNSGKSATLREILSTITSTAEKEPLAHNKVVKDLVLSKSGNAKTLKAFLDESAEFVQGQYRFQNAVVGMNQIRLFDGKYIGSTGRLFCKSIGAEGRLAIAKTQNSVAPGDQKSVPQHILFDSERLTLRISGHFRNAFGEDLMIDYRGGNKIPIHVGQRPDGPENWVSDEYVQKVRANPNLEDQGDGMRSYAGILFEVIAVDHDITLLDEPEAFLHPPQMRRIGETLAEHARGQLFVATHSADILRGFLNATQGKLRIIRLQRADKINRATETEPEAIKSLWDQPELRYSNALEGIFHEQAIICEDDSDCRLYNSVADHLAKEHQALIWPDTLYIPSGGKQSVPKIAGALHQMGVPVKAIFDIDFLSEGELVKSVVESLGGSWEDFEANWKRLDAAVRDGVKPKSHTEIAKEIIRVLEGIGDQRLPKSKIRDLLKDDRPWSMIKKIGKEALPRGEARSVFDRLTKSLTELGVHVVQIGQLENFCPELGSEGPRFVSKLLNSIPLGDPKLEQLRLFVAKLRA